MISNSNWLGGLLAALLLAPAAVAQPSSGDTVGARGILAGERGSARDATDDAAAPQVWTSDVTLQRVRGTWISPQPLNDVDAVLFRARDLGARRNLQFQLQLYAEGITDDPRTAAFDPGGRLAALDLRVESPFIANGALSLRVLHRDAGPFRNDFVMGWSLADPRNFNGGSSPRTGRYPVRILQGTRELGSCVLYWIQDAADPVDAVGPESVLWKSGVLIRDTQGHWQNTYPLRDVSFALSSFGARSSLAFEFQIYVPGLTDRGDLSSAQQQQALTNLGLRVESPWLIDGSLSLQLLREGAGPYGHNWVVGWSLADGRNFQGGSGPPSGSYPVRFLVGSASAGSCQLDWTR